MVAAVRALWKREIVKFVRDRSRLVGALVQPLGFWLLLGLGFRASFQMPGAGAGAMGYMEYLFPGILALVLLFTAIFSTISIVEERRSGFLQAALVAPTPRVAVVLGSVLGGTTLAVAESLLFLLLLPLMGVGVTLAGLALLTLACTLTGIAFTALGVAIAWKHETTRGFHAVMNLFLLPMWLLSGAFFPAEGATAALAWLMRVNPATYAVGAIRQSLYWPEATAGAPASLGVCLLATAVFAAAMLALATRGAAKRGVPVV